MITRVWVKGKKAGYINDKYGWISAYLHDDDESTFTFLKGWHTKAGHRKVRIKAIRAVINEYKRGNK